MPRRRLELIRRSADPSKIPDKLGGAVALLLDLERRGVVAQLAERAKIRRQGGYAAIDVVLLLLVLFGSGLPEGIKTAWQTIGRHAVALARLAGRKRLPSPPAVSRALASVESSLSRPLQSWLLGPFSGVDDVMRHPSVRFVDACGAPWQVFDLDPTVTTLRHRALPEEDDLPEPMRRSEETAAPGFSGRKRGNMQFRRITVQHAGSGAWVHAHLSRGNGDGVADLDLALQAITETCSRLGVATSRALVRTDGEYGTAGSLAAFRRHGLPLLVRLQKASLMHEPAVLARLAKGPWYPVPDSRSGPRRFAVEVGTVQLGTEADADETTSIRAVASVYEDVTGRGRGKTIDGWRVELFGIDAPADAWPAPDAVAAYFGRAGQENRFAQEDRELGLDRIFSYELAGQELATVVGLAVWNVQLARGFESDPPPAKEPPPELRPEGPVFSPPPGWPRDPKITGLLNRLDWTSAMASRPGWRWSTATGSPECPDGRPTEVSCVPTGVADGPRAIVFRRRRGGCEDCAQRSACLRSDQPHASKHLQIRTPFGMALAVEERLEVLRAARREAVPAAPPPSRRVATPRFLPAAARQLHRARFQQMAVWIRVEDPPERAAPRLLAVDDRGRQRRRKTWQQRVDDYAAPPDALIEVEIAASDDVHRFLDRDDVGVTGVQQS